MNGAAPPPAIFLYGPTACGKTDLATELVARLPLEIISVDSAMVYRGMDIGTAKPDPDLLARAPHRLIDILDPAEAYSAARFREDALHEMEKITRAGRVPLLVGGTMLYFRALESGLADLPAADQAVRADIERMAAENGWEGVHARLAEVDPESAARIHPNDPQRLQRALEVWRLTGRPLSSFHREDRGKALPYRVLRLALVPPSRALLRERIARRFAGMLKAGLLGEVEALRARGDLNPELPSIRAVGYRQAWEYLDGRIDREEMVRKAVAATCGLAKRQLTWLNAWPDVPRMESGACEQAAALIAARLGA